MQPTRGGDTEVTPDVLTAAKVQLLNGARTGLETLSNKIYHKRVNY